jgi:hypothetical protein
MSLFSNLSLQSSFNQINSASFRGAMGFAMFNSYYYVCDYWLSNIFILNESWSYVSSKVFSNPVYLTTIFSSLYAAGAQNIWKLDQNLNILTKHTEFGPFPGYKGICYNSANNLIYVAPCNLNVIHVLDLNLRFNHTFSISTYQPWSIAEYNNEMYVGTSNGTILIIVNEVIIRTFNGCNANSVALSYILFDKCGLMATSCHNNQLYLYYPNGTYLGKNSITPVSPYYIGYDSNGRFVQISNYQINIFNKS